ncbi:SET domain-containing protein 4 [Chelonia mydas]|uniref:SET domain-containing protein 4 n=1 Tax=Chelonia mydas TaxID=8469 RepID=M7C7S8_CHEMY|nr:SET domain-containing protein 4 [Chelonia mydas]
MQPGLRGGSTNFAAPSRRRRIPAAAELAPRFFHFELSYGSVPIMTVGSRGTVHIAVATTRSPVKAAFNEQTRCYEIRTDSHCRRHEELFISYGPHDNQRLLLEYGFVAINNPQSGVYVSTDILLKHLLSADKQRNMKLSILKDHNLLENLTFGRDGPSWRLLTALKLLCLGADEL